MNAFLSFFSFYNVWSTDLEHVEIYIINIAIRVKSVDFHASPEVNDATAIRPIATCI
jgi:hypothetical protein